VNDLSSFSSKKTPYSHLKTLKKQTLSFFENNDNIILTRTDKGNITVALDKNNYIRGIEKILQDSNIYDQKKSEEHY